MTPSKAKTILQLAAQIKQAEASITAGKRLIRYIRNHRKQVMQKKATLHLNLEGRFGNGMWVELDPTMIVDELEALLKKMVQAATKTLQEMEFPT